MGSRLVSGLGEHFSGFESCLPQNMVVCFTRILVGCGRMVAELCDDDAWHEFCAAFLFVQALGLLPSYSFCWDSTTSVPPALKICRRLSCKFDTIQLLFVGSVRPNPQS